VHLDAYRIESPREMDNLLIEEFLISPWCLAVEWPEKVAAWLPPGALHLDLGITPDQRHTLRLR
jgi:tRNA threonylcarbamoyladenosine biosynthesis protein TsaE